MRLSKLVILGIALVGGTALIARTAVAQTYAEGSGPEAQFASWQNIQADVVSLHRENAELHQRLSELESAAFAPMDSDASGCGSCATVPCQTSAPCPPAGGFGGARRSTT